MACNIDKVVNILKSNGNTKDAINKIIDSNIQAIKALDGLVKDATDASLDETSYRNYLLRFEKILMNGIKPSIEFTYKFNEELLLTLLDGYSPAAYNVNTNTIEVNRGYTQQEIADIVVREATNMVDDRGTKLTIAEASAITKTIDANILTMENAKGDAVFLHEVLHAASTRQLLKGTSKAAKRVEKLFTQAKKELEHLGIGQNYWMTNSREFIAEGLSNHELMYHLSKMEPTEKDSKLASAFHELYKTLLELVGLDSAKFESVYDYLLDAQLSMLNDSQFVVAKKTREDQVTPKELLGDYDNEAMQRAKDILTKLTEECS